MFVPYHMYSFVWDYVQEIIEMQMLDLIGKKIRKLKVLYFFYLWSLKGYFTITDQAWNDVMSLPCRRAHSISWLFINILNKCRDENNITNTFCYNAEQMLMTRIFWLQSIILHLVQPHISSLIDEFSSL